MSAMHRRDAGLRQSLPSSQTPVRAALAVYPPLAYGGVATQLARTYGDSWPDWPPSAQIQVAEQILRVSGWSAWTTAAACGL